MKKIVFLAIILLFAISSARFTVSFLDGNDTFLAAIALLLTVVFGAFFVQEMGSLEKDYRQARKGK